MTTANPTALQHLPEGMTADPVRLIHFALSWCDPADGDKQAEITPEPLTIGSGPKCTLRLQASGVKPLHCVVTLRDGAPHVRRWANGALLNGEEFTESFLRAGDTIAIAGHELEVYTLDAGSPELPADDIEHTREEGSHIHQEKATPSVVAPNVSEATEVDSTAEDPAEEEIVEVDDESAELAETVAKLRERAQSNQARAKRLAAALRESRMETITAKSEAASLAQELHAETREAGFCDEPLVEDVETEKDSQDDGDAVTAATDTETDPTFEGSVTEESVGESSPESDELAEEDVDQEPWSLASEEKPAAEAPEDWDDATEETSLSEAEAVDDLWDSDTIEETEEGLAESPEVDPADDAGASESLFEDWTSSDPATESEATEDGTLEEEVEGAEAAGEDAGPGEEGFSWEEPHAADDFDAGPESFQSVQLAEEDLTDEQESTGETAGLDEDTQDHWSADEESPEASATVYSPDEQPSVYSEVDEDAWQPPCLTTNSADTEEDTEESIADPEPVDASLDQETSVEDEPTEEPAAAPPEQASFYERFAHMLPPDEHDEAPEAPSIPALAEPTPAAALQDNDDSLDSYMKEFMGRICPGGDASDAGALLKNLKEKKPDADEAEPKPAEHDPDITLLTELPQRNTPTPESMIDLKQIRNLANESARGAIETAETNRHKENTILQLSLTAFGVFISLLVCLTSSTLLSGQFFCGALGLIGSIVFGARAIQDGYQMLLEYFNDSVGAKPVSNAVADLSDEDEDDSAPAPELLEALYSSSDAAGGFDDGDDD